MAVKYCHLEIQNFKFLLSVILYLFNLVFCLISNRTLQTYLVICSVRIILNL